MQPAESIGWLAIVRLGLVQAALGSVVVLTTSTLNRVMVVELALPALIPGLLVGLHYAVQLLRPRMGFGSDLGQRRTPWIVGGVIALAVGGFVAALGTVWAGTRPAAGILLATLGFMLIGVGVSASGTSLLALLATRVKPHIRAPAATIVWLMMIAGFAVTATVAGRLLDPFTPARLLAVSGAVSLIAVIVTLVALFRLEGRPDAKRVAGAGAAGRRAGHDGTPATRFIDALSQVWAEPAARRFTVFVFVSMLAYSAQDLILEPFAGTVFGMTPGQSTALAGLQHAGVLVGMVVVALCGSGLLGPRLGSLSGWMIGGCIGSAAALLGLVGAGAIGPGWPLSANVFLLGLGNGIFSIAAIASMMRMAGEGRGSREGTRMGLWGAAQAIAFGLGGFAGAAASDLARWLIGSPAQAYAAVFLIEAVLFLVAGRLAARLKETRSAADAFGGRADRSASAAIIPIDAR